MDLRTRLLELVAPLSEGEELSPGVRFLGASTEVGMCLSFSVGGATARIDVTPRGEGRFAARTARYCLSYRLEGGRSLLDPTVGLDLCKAVAERVERNEDRVAAAWPSGATATGERAPPRVREVRVARMLEPAGEGRDLFYKLSPYVGCLIGCRYCYAQTPVAQLRRLEGLPIVPWGSYVDVRTNAAEILTEELARLPPRPLKFSPIVSDPYQAVEATHEVTRRCLEAIRDADADWPALLLTRSKLVTRDRELLASLRSGWVGASIPTIDDAVRRHFEPRAASIAERLASLGSLREAGVFTFAVVQPLLPGSIQELADALARVVSSVSIDVLRGEELAGADFDHPAYAAARSGDWQEARAAELRAALAKHGVRVWSGELPDELRARAEESA